MLQIINRMEVCKREEFLWTGLVKIIGGSVGWGVEIYKNTSMRTMDIYLYGVIKNRPQSNLEYLRLFEARNFNK